MLDGYDPKKFNNTVTTLIEFKGPVQQRTERIERVITCLTQIVRSFGNFTRETHIRAVHRTAAYAACPVATHFPFGKVKPNGLKKLARADCFWAQ